MIAAKVEQLVLSNMGFVVLLKGEGSDRSLPIFIGAAEAQAIAVWLNKVKIPRPLTHDLFKNVLDSLECPLVRIEICDLVEGTFFARLVLLRGGTEVAIDSRPSDALALALRFEAPIFIEEKVMSEAGRVFQEGDAPAQQAAPSKGPPKPKPVARKLSPLEQLKADLEKAVQEERYEDAAKLRDEINRVEHSHN